MNSFVLFILKPNQYFRDLNDGKMRRYLLNLLIVYAIVYTVYSLQVGSHKNVNVSMICNNAVIDLICYFFLEILSIFFVSAIILVITKVMHIRFMFFNIVINIFSLKAIEVLFMILEVLIFNVFGSVSFFGLLDWVSLIVFLCYLYFPIKGIFEASFARNIIIQLIAFLGYLTFYFGISIVYLHCDTPPNTGKLVEYLSHNEIKEAINESDSLINQFPLNSNLRYDIGKAFAMYLLLSEERQPRDDEKKKDIYQNIFHRAEECFISALNLKPTNVEARRALGDLYHINGDNNKAIEQYTIAIENGLSSHDIYRKLATEYLRLGNQKQAQHYYKLIAKTNKVAFQKDKSLKIALKDIIGQELGIDAEAVLGWCVKNEMQFDLSSGDEEMAYLWIKGGLSLALNKIMLTDYENDASIIDFANRSINSVIADANQFFEKNRYGIEIENIKIVATPSPKKLPSDP